MPRYEYKCRECDVEFEISHSMKEKMSDCGSCKAEGSLFKVIASFAVSGFESSDSDNHQKPGKVVNEFIEETKTEVSQYKNELSRNMVDVNEIGE